MKKCTKCGIEKELTNFHKKSTTKDGLRHWCKSCVSEYDEIRYGKDPTIKQKHRESSRKWYLKNKDKPEFKEKRKKYYSTPEAKEKKRQYDKERNADPTIRQKKIEYSRKFYKENKEYYKKYQEENREEILAKSKECYSKRCEKEPACVYQILNTINGKVYIGETTRGKLRWKQHLEHLRGNRHTNSTFQQDFNEHGEEVFKWSIIKELPKDKEMLMLEEAREVQRRLDHGEQLYNKIIPKERG